MKRLISLLTICASMFSALTALAQEQSTTAATTSTTQVEPSTREERAKYRFNHVEIDGAAILLEGIGAGYDILINRNVSIGGNISMYRLSSVENTGLSNLIDDEARLVQYGARARYYLNDPSLQGSAFGVIGANYTTLKDRYTTFLGSSGSDKDDEWGGLLGVGYQFLLNEIKETGNLLARFALTYGNGYTVRRDLKNGQLESEIEYGMGLEATLGFLF